MTHNTEWTTLEIEQMKTAFLKGKTIKAMARELGRTPTALNKALSRFGIRPYQKLTKKDSQSPISWHSAAIPSIVPSAIPRSIPPSKAWPRKLSAISFPSHESLIDRESVRTSDPRWVSLEQVIYYLERQGYRVQTPRSRLKTYELDGQAVQASALLLLANRLRHEERKPIFMVREITW